MRLVLRMGGGETLTNEPTSDGLVVSESRVLRSETRLAVGPDSGRSVKHRRLHH